MRNEVHPTDQHTQAERFIGVGVFLSSFGLYLWNTSPGAYWLDSSEFVAAGYTLGIPHPPGHPLYMALAKAASFVPFGSIAFRINLLSGFLGAICVWLTYVLGVLLIRSLRWEMSRWAVPVAAAAGALTFAVSGAMWLQSVRAEVYTLNTAITLGACIIGARWYLSESTGRTPVWNGNAPLFTAVALLGCGLANHHYLVVFCVPALVVLALSSPRGRTALRSPGRLFSLFAVGAIGLGLYAYLPIRGASETVINWTTPTTLDRFVDAVTATVFQQSVTHTEGPGIATNIHQAIYLLTQQLHPGTVLIGGLGLTLVFFRKPGLGIFALVTLVLNLLTKSIMDFDPTNPDAWGYLQLSHAWVSALASVGIAGGLALLFYPPPEASSEDESLKGWKWAIGLIVASLICGGIAILGETGLTLPTDHPLVEGFQLGFKILVIGAFFCLLSMLLKKLGVLLVTLTGASLLRWRTTLTFALLGCWSLVVITQYVSYRNECDLSTFRAPEKVEDAFFRESPPGGILMASHFSVYFNHWHAQLVEGHRPDLTIFNQTFDAKLYGGVPYTQRLKRLYPRWESIFDAFLETGTTPNQALLQTAREHPVFLEPEADLRDGRMLDHMEGRGITFQLGGDKRPSGGKDGWKRLYATLTTDELETYGTWSLLLLHHFSAAVVHLKKGEIAQVMDETNFGERIKGGGLWDGLRLYATHLQRMSTNPAQYKAGIAHFRKMVYRDFLRPEALQQ